MISRNLPPLIGGMERLIYHVTCELNKEFKVILVGPEGCKRYLPSDIEVREVKLRQLPVFLVDILLSSYSISKDKKIDIVFAGSGLVALPAFLLSKLRRAATVVYIHGLDVEVDSLPYRKIWYPVFRKFDCIIANSNFTKYLTLKAGVKKERIKLLHPGVKIPDWSQRDIRRETFRRKHEIGKEPVMLYVGRITERKGLFPFIRDVLPEIIDKIPNAKLVIIGDEPERSLLKNDGILLKIHKKIDELGFEDNVMFLGKLEQDDPELSDAYFAADVLVFPVQARAGDNEGFGMVAIEAAAHGLPTVTFDAGGVSDAVCQNVSGFVVEKDDSVEFGKKIVIILKGKYKFDKNRILEHAKKYAWPIFGDRLRKIVRSVLN